MANWRDIPVLVRHSTIAIYNKSTGGGPQGFMQALRISRDTLANAGYLYQGKGLALLEGIKLTGKGWLRNRQHEAEGRSGDAKDRQFESLWKSIAEKIPELDGPSGKKADPPKNVKEAASAESNVGVKSPKQKDVSTPKKLYPPK